MYFIFFHCPLFDYLFSILSFFVYFSLFLYLFIYFPLFLYLLIFHSLSLCLSIFCSLSFSYTFSLSSLTIRGWKPLNTIRNCTQPYQLKCSPISAFLPLASLSCSFQTKGHLSTPLLRVHLPPSYPIYYMRLRNEARGLR